MNKHPKVLASFFHMKLAEESLSVCQVTGITLKTSLPFIQGRVYEYQNPLALISNAKDLASQDYATCHAHLSPSILSGILLSLLTHYDLINDKLSAVERNILLSEIPSYHISQLLRFLTSLTAKKIELLPSFSLDNAESKESSNLNLLQVYLASCKKALEIEEIIPISQTKITRINKALLIKSIEPETRKLAKSLVDSLVESGTITTKFAHVLKIIWQKDNIITMSPDFRAKIMTKLSDLQTPLTDSLVSLMKSTISNMSVQERIINKQLETGLDSFSSLLKEQGSQIPAVRMSLKEILEAKARGQFHYPTEETNIQDSNIQEEQDNNNEQNYNLADEIKEIAAEVQQEYALIQEQLIESPKEDETGEEIISPLDSEIEQLSFYNRNEQTEIEEEGEENE